MQVCLVLYSHLWLSCDKACAVCVIDAGRLAPEYVKAQQAAWRTGSHFTPSFLLPIEPLTQEVALTKNCHLSGT